MELTKEEIRGKIDILSDIVEGLKLDDKDDFNGKSLEYINGYNQSINDAIEAMNGLINLFKQQLEQTKSIVDIEREAFNAGFEFIGRSKFDDIELHKRDCKLRYEDYLKSKEDGIKNS